jgi:aminopeptidase N
LLSLPGETEIASYIAEDVDPGAIHAARTALEANIAGSLLTEFDNLYASLASNEAYQPDPAGTGRRALRATALQFIVAGAPERGIELAAAQAEAATNMSEEMTALSVLTKHEGAAREKALDGFYQKNQKDHLLVDKWLGLQAQSMGSKAIARIRELLSHEAFSMKRPNKVRALVGMFAMDNPVTFHDATGAGYTLFGDVIIELDKINPQVAARLSASLKTWKTLEPGRQAHAKAQLQRIKATEPLSKDLYEIVSKTLEA